MRFKYTGHQVARGAFPDAKQGDRIFLFKNLATLRATYQVRLLTYLAAEGGLKLIIDVPDHFKPHPTLSALMKEYPKVLRLEKASPK
jgi:hypothetical protein